MDIQTKRIIHEELAHYFDCDVALFSTGGTTLRTPESLVDGEILVYTKVADRVIISGSSPTIAEVRGIMSANKPQLTTDDLLSFLPDFVIDETYPCAVYTAGRVSHREPPSDYAITQQDTDDPDPVRSLVAKCSDDDLDGADIDLENPDEEIVLAWFEGEPVGYAGYRILERSLGDVGVIVTPEHRRRGLGTALVSSITEICRRNGKIPLYRYDSANTCSGAIQNHVGYEVFWETIVLVKR